MANKGNSRIRRWLSNRRLISVEAILLVGLLDNLIENWVEGLSWPDALKTVFIMLSTAGAFGLLMGVFVALTSHSLTKGQKLVRALPIATPYLVIHGIVLVGIYWLYATYY